MCGCYSLNGKLPVFCAQFLLFLGMMFSWAGLIDCSFTTVDTEFTLGEEFAGLPFTSTTNLGLVTFMKPDGRCYFYEITVTPDDQLDWYIRTLTPEWNTGRGFAVAAGLGGIAAFLYSLSFSCSSQVRGFRYFMVMVSSVILPIFQALVFLTFSSDFCGEHECGLSRSSILCIVSACCYFEAGLGFLVMTDYPGETLLARERKMLLKQKLERKQEEVMYIDNELFAPSRDVEAVQPEPELSVQLDDMSFLDDKDVYMTDDEEEATPDKVKENYGTDDEESDHIGEKGKSGTDDEESDHIGEKGKSGTDDVEANHVDGVDDMRSEEEADALLVFEDDVDQSASDLESVLTNPFYPKPADYAVLGQAHYE